MSPKLSHNELTELILLTFDGKISEDQFKTLEEQIIYHQEARDCYYKLLVIYTGLSDYNNSGIFFRDMSAGTEDACQGLSLSKIEGKATVFDMDLWSKLAEDELFAPKIDLPEPEEKIYCIQKAEASNIKLNVNRSSIISLIISAAAIIMIILFSRYAPPRSGYDVATLIDSVDAEWGNASLENGSRLVTGDVNWQLESGVAELLFDNNARITIEGPAEFHIAMADQISLKYGRAYAYVPPEAVGFILTTPNSKIIDLGTEFGVEAGFGGTTELHVIQGKTTLISGNQKHKSSVSVTEGIAKKVSGVDGKVSDIRCEKIKFVRKINPISKRAWRGENLSLTSIISQHDGFQRTDSFIGINPDSGEFTTSIVANDRPSNNTYNLVKESDFIDGIFVPDGESGPVQITSSGYTFNCPNTSGVFTHELAAYKGNIENQHSTVPALVFKGKKYEEDPILMLHSNLGITFDLSTIRQSLPDLDMKCFKAMGVLTEEFDNREELNPDVEFWVLVDGQIRYEKRGFKFVDGSFTCEVELKPHDRFLTLIVTDGLKPEDGKREFPYGNDYFYLVDPQLCLTEIFE